MLNRNTWFSIRKEYRQDEPRNYVFTPISQHAPQMTKQINIRAKLNQKKEQYRLDELEESSLCSKQCFDFSKNHLYSVNVVNMNFISFIWLIFSL